MLDRRSLRDVCTVLIVILLSSKAWALSGKEHADKWNEVFGITDALSKKNIKPLWDAAQDLIDRTNIKLERIEERYGDSQYASEDIFNSSYTSLKNRFPWFKWGDHGHRLMFHWGFNQHPDRGATPAEHPPLVRQVKACLDIYVNKSISDDKMTQEEGAKFRKEQRELFFKYIMTNMQAPRNRALIRKVVDVTGIPTSRGYANAVATILYDIHLLADYETTKKSGLQSIKSIEQDLINLGFGRLLKRGDQTKLLEKVSKELDDAIHAGRGRTNERRAELLVDVTKKYLPLILNERFQNTLKARGIIITEPEK